MTQPSLLRSIFVRKARRRRSKCRDKILKWVSVSHKLRDHSLGRFGKKSKLNSCKHQAAVHVLSRGWLPKYKNVPTVALHHWLIESQIIIAIVSVSREVKPAKEEEWSFHRNDFQLPLKKTPVLHVLHRRASKHHSGRMKRETFTLLGGKHFLQKYKCSAMKNSCMTIETTTETAATTTMTQAVTATAIDNKTKTARNSTNSNNNYMHLITRR